MGLVEEPITPTPGFHTTRLGWDGAEGHALLDCVEGESETQEIMGCAGSRVLESGTFRIAFCIWKGAKNDDVFDRAQKREQKSEPKTQRQTMGHKESEGERNLHTL